MNKKVRSILTFGLSLSCMTFFASCTIQKAEALDPAPDLVYVDFFDNYLREEFTLSSGYSGKGNNLIYKTVSCH